MPEKSRSPQSALPLKPKSFLILLTLEELGPLHGYAIKKAMHDRSAGSVTIDPGGLYRLVARLERNGLVRRADRPPGDPDERRQYLAITNCGREVLAAEVNRMASLMRLPSVRALAEEAG